MPFPTMHRRRWLRLCAAAALPAFSARAALAQPGGKEPVAVAQIADMSAGQQDVSRDFLIGSRAAWQALNAQGGIQGRPVQHLTFEVDGTGPGLQAAWQSALAHPGCVALSGSVGDGVSVALAALQAAQPGPPIAQAAPWLHSEEASQASDTLFGIFPGYQAQIAHALKTLAVMGVPELGVVYASAAVRQQSQTRVQQAAQALGLRAQAIPLNQATPAQTIVLFVGGTPELHDFVRKLVLQPGRHCYIVALADVNLQVLAQMGGSVRNASVIATQAVPLVTAGLPIVRAYREALARLYDEPPSPQGLAGFIAARYTAEVLQGISGPITRASALAAFRRRQGLDLGGFSVAFEGRRRASAYVTQSMLTADGRIVG